MRRAMPGLVVLAAAAGCFPGPADNPKDVHDLRVLAMRLDPPEVELPLDPAAPPVEVLATALIASPGGGTVTASFAGCVDPGSDACIESPLPDPPALYAELYRRTEQSLEVAAPPRSPDVRAETTRSFSAELIEDLLVNAPLVGLAGARPALEIRASGSDGEEAAFKRLQVSYPDIFYRTVLAQVGLPTCDAQGLPEGCLDFLPKTANTNPTLLAIDWLAGDDLGGEVEPRPLPAGPLVVEPNETVRLFPRVDDADFEEYQTLGVNFDTQELFINDIREYLVFSWFATGGQLDLSATDPDRDFGAQNDWFAPGEEGDYWVWVVVRDTRGGVDFDAVHLRVTAP